MITINVTRLSSGLIIGCTFSDRWNMRSLLDLGRETGLQLDINQCSLKGQIDRLRRTLKGLGFRLSLKTHAPVVLARVPAEVEAMLGASEGRYRPSSMRKAS